MIPLLFQLLNQMTEISNELTNAEKSNQFIEGKEKEYLEENDGGEKMKGTFVQKTISMNENKTLV